MVMDPEGIDAGELNMAIDEEKEDNDEKDEEPPGEEELFQIFVQALKGVPDVATIFVIVTLGEKKSCTGG